jgi:hypothetical protein
MLTLPDSVLYQVNLGWLNLASQQLHTKMRYYSTPRCYNDVVDNVYAPIKNMILPTMHAIRMDMVDKTLAIVYHE